jgi:hypothetical protein
LPHTPIFLELVAPFCPDFRGELAPFALGTERQILRLCFVRVEARYGRDSCNALISVLFVKLQMCEKNKFLGYDLQI